MAQGLIRKGFYGSNRSILPFQCKQCSVQRRTFQIPVIVQTSEPNVEASQLIVNKAENSQHNVGTPQLIVKNFSG